MYAIRSYYDKIDVLKGPVSIDELLKTNEYKILKRKILDKRNLEKSSIVGVGGRPATALRQP